jgi:FkbM family methyltransferase
MLITINELKTKFNIQVTGILHIGAHTCEELQSYLQLGVNNNNIYWIEAIQELVDAKIQQNAFNITRNAHTGDSQSSSMLDFGSHAISHPQVKIVNKRKMKTSRMETVIERNNIDMSIVNFVNLDIQGVELRALKSMEKYLSNIKYIYTEVNTEQVYKDCDQMNDLTNYLKTLGFILTDTRIYKEYGWGDAFYIKN